MPLPYFTPTLAALELPLRIDGIFSLYSSHSHKSPPGKDSDCRWIWRNTDAVCFDVDSTVCEDEAIDELAEFCGVGAQVAELTRVAMNGNLTFRQALTARLNLIRPSHDQIKRFIELNPPRLTPGIAELCQALRNLNIPIYLITGGFRCIVEPVAAKLQIPASHVFANDLLFDTAANGGAFLGFDHEQPTSDSGGKAAVCGLLKRRHGYRRLVMVGDGATDAETAPPADAFIGFGGNVARPGVVRRAHWFVYNFDELRRALRAPHDAPTPGA